MKNYSPSIDRRTTIKWMLAGLGSVSMANACGQPNVPSADALRLGKAASINGTTYGVDPDMIEPSVTWARTMTSRQLELAGKLSDVVLPATNELPAASAVGVPDFIDEWVSSPYEMTQNDRVECFDLFEWMEAEAVALSGVSFVEMSDENVTKMLDRIAWKDSVESGLEKQADAFNTFRTLATSAYFASEEGEAWIGYMGNQPITGAYPGPTPEALKHLREAMKPLGLTIPKGL